jgi:hypothetical protein
MFAITRSLVRPLALVGYVVAETAKKLAVSLGLTVNLLALVLVRFRVVRLSSDTLEDASESCVNGSESAWSGRLARWAFRELAFGFAKAARARRIRELIRGVGQEEAQRRLQGGSPAWERAGFASEAEHLAAAERRLEDAEN